MPPIVGVLIVVGVVLVVLVGAMLAYSGLMSRRLTAQQDYATLEAMLKRRREQIASLADLIRGPLAYQPRLFETLDAALANARAAKAPAANAAAQADLEQSLAEVITAIDRQPAVRTGQDLQALRNQLVASQRDTDSAANSYNISAGLYNAHRQALPVSIVAALLAFAPMQLFADTREPA